MLAFYMDEHIDPKITRALRNIGIDVLTAQEARRAGTRIPDAIQLAYAAAQNRVMITGDWDFLTFAYTVHPHAGVVLIPRLVDIGSTILYLEIIASTVRAEDIASRLLVYPQSWQHT